jgi:polyribonucleotide nucleotidyltransferase
VIRGDGSHLSPISARSSTWGGVDGLLHVSDMTYQRGIKPSDVVTAGQEIDVKILKINRESRKDSRSG